jgi:hypothetical protein
MTSEWDLQEIIDLLISARDSTSQTDVDPFSERLTVIRAGDAAIWLADQLVENNRTSVEFPEQHRMARELAEIGGIADIDDRLRPVVV